MKSLIVPAVLSNVTVKSFPLITAESWSSDKSRFSIDAVFKVFTAGTSNGTVSCPCATSCPFSAHEAFSFNLKLIFTKYSAPAFNCGFLNGTVITFSP